MFLKVLSMISRARKAQKKQSRWRDLNSRPLPYQGSALPLSYTGVVLSGRRGSNPRPLAWKANALPTELLPQHSKSLDFTEKEPLRLFSCGRRWIRTTEGVNQQIYSLPHLATLVFSLFCVLFLPSAVLHCALSVGHYLRGNSLPPRLRALQPIRNRPQNFLFLPSAALRHRKISKELRADGGSRTHDPEITNHVL